MGRAKVFYLSLLVCLVLSNVAYPASFEYLAQGKFYYNGQIEDVWGNMVISDEVNWMGGTQTSPYHDSFFFFDIESWAIGTNTYVYGGQHGQLVDELWTDDSSGQTLGFQYYNLYGGIGNWEWFFQPGSNDFNFYFGDGTPVPDNEAYLTLAPIISLEWDADGYLSLELHRNEPAPSDPVPEPATIFLVAIGIIGTAGFKKMKITS